MLILNQEIYIKWQVKPTVDINGLYNYAAHILRPQNTESGEPELNNIGEKSQDKNELILHNIIIKSVWKQITNMMQGFVPIFQDSYKMSLEWISTLSLSWRIIISIHLFKRVTDDMSDFPLSKKLHKCFNHFIQW